MYVCLVDDANDEEAERFKYHLMRKEKFQQWFSRAVLISKAILLMDIEYGVSLNTFARSPSEVISECFYSELASVGGSFIIASIDEDGYATTADSA